MSGGPAERAVQRRRLLRAIDRDGADADHDETDGAGADPSTTAGLRTAPSSSVSERDARREHSSDRLARIDPERPATFDASDLERVD